MDEPTTSTWALNGGRRITDSNAGWESTAPMPSEFLYDDNENHPYFFSDGDSISNLKQNENHQSRAAFGPILDQTSGMSTKGESYPESRSQGPANVDFPLPSNMSNVGCLSMDQVVPRLHTVLPSNFMSSPTNNTDGRSDVAWPLEDVSIMSPTSFEAQGDCPTSLSKWRIIGNGIIARKEKQKARSSPIQKLVKHEKIRKKTSTARRSLLNALDLIEQLRLELDVFSRLDLPINQLEESVEEELLRETRASRPIPLLKDSPNNDSAYHSVTDSYSFGDTASISATSDFSLQRQTGSSTSVTSCKQINSEEYSMDVAMDIETPRAQQLVTPVYHCTFASNGTLCNFTTKFRCDWIRHEESEKHWPQKRYMCLLCIGVIMDDEGQPLCTFCFERLPASANNKAHYLRCEKAKNRGRHILAAARDEHFRIHLRKFHEMQGIDTEAATWIFDVPSKWPRLCGFCPDRFTTWEERASHIALHFEQGMDISSWKPQFPKPKRLGDHRPGIDHHKRDDDDGDDDNDENHYPDHGNWNGNCQEYSMSYSSSASSPLPTNSTQYTSDDWGGWVGNVSFGSELKEDIPRAKVERYLHDQNQALSDTVPDAPPSPIDESFGSRSSPELLTSTGIDIKEPMLNMPARLEALSKVPHSLTETVSATTDVDPSALDLPLQRCGNAYREFQLGRTVLRYKHQLCLPRIEVINPGAGLIDLAAGLLGLATFAWQSSVSLHKTIQSIQFHPKLVRDLKEELEALSGVLGLLTETASVATDVDLSALNLPLRRCNNACKEFEQEIKKCSSRSDGNRTSFRDWTKLRYMGDGIDSFRQLLAGYKSTIIIALTDANLRKSSVTAESLEFYRDLTKTTADDLEAYLQGIDKNLETIFGHNVSESGLDATELRLIKEEQMSTQKCLEICAQFSDQINQIQIIHKRGSPGPVDQAALPESLTTNGLQGCKSRLILTAEKLEGYTKDLIEQIVTNLKTAMTSKEDLVDLVKLREEWETTCQCMNICSKAYIHLKENISNIDNYATGGDVQFMISTDGKTIHGRNRGLGWRTRQVGGNISDVLLQQLSRDIASRILKNEDPSLRGSTLSVSNPSGQIDRQVDKVRTNVFEDVSADQYSYSLMLSTDGHLVSARRVTCETGSAQWVGRMLDAIV